MRVAVHREYELVARGVAIACARSNGRLLLLRADDKAAARPDILLDDPDMLSERSARVVQDLRERSGAAQVVAFRWSENGRLDWGFDAQLSKKLPLDALAAALLDIHRGLRPAEPAPSVTPPRAPDREPDRDNPLTPRETEILIYIVAGLTNQEIAARMWLSPNTVKSYIRSAYRRIGVTRRAQAVLWGMQHGLTGSVAPPRPHVA